MKRKIIRIDEDKCTGCGECIPNCAEGSLEIRNGKAVLVKEALCDGLGACLGHCPEGALIIEERDAEAFDEALVEQRLAEIGRQPAPHGAPAGGGCPSAQPFVQTQPPAAPRPAHDDAPPSRLGHWPVQLTLLPPTAPFFKDQELLITADCVPFAFADFHRRFLDGRAVAVACPKLDNTGPHFAKLIQIFKEAGLASATIVRMEVPCCGGLTNMVAEAREEAGTAVPLREVVIGRGGEVLQERDLT